MGPFQLLLSIFTPSCLYPVSSQTILLRFLQRAKLLLLSMFSPLSGMNFTHLSPWKVPDVTLHRRAFIPHLGEVPLLLCSHSPYNFVVVLATPPVYFSISPTTWTSLRVPWREELHFTHCGISRKAQCLHIVEVVASLWDGPQWSRSPDVHSHVYLLTHYWPMHIYGRLYKRQNIPWQAM